MNVLILMARLVETVVGTYVHFLQLKVLTFYIPLYLHKKTSLSLIIIKPGCKC